MTALVQLIGDIQSSRYAALASSCVIFFDYFLTLEDEVEYIWNAPWTPGKTLFIINRYYTLLSAVFNNYGLLSPYINDTFCLHWIRWQGYTGLISAMLAQMILQMRLYALYCMDRRIIICVTLFFIACSAASAAVMTDILAHVSVSSEFIPSFKFCTPHGINNHLYAFWIPILCSESLLCFMALYRGFTTLKEEGDLPRGDIFLQLAGRRLVRMLIQDSVLYFLATFATYFTNLIMFIAAPITLIEIPIGFSVSIASVLASRLILHIRQARKEFEPSRSHISLVLPFSPGLASPRSHEPPWYGEDDTDDVASEFEMREVGVAV